MSRRESGTAPGGGRRARPAGDPHVANVSGLLRVLDEGFDGRAWHGPNLMNSLRGVDTGLASWRPGPDRHSIWELVLHTAYWKWTVRKRIGAASGRFARPGSNFPAMPDDPDTAGWERDVQLLRDEHAQLRAAVASLAPGSLLRQLGAEQRWTVEDTVRGIAFHDVYHAGQIRLLKRLFEAETHR
jgi:hypothetical protein